MNGKSKKTASSGSASSKANRGKGDGAGKSRQTPAPSTQAAKAPLFMTSDPDQQLCYVIGDLIQEKAAQLPLGDVQMLDIFVRYVIDMVRGTGFVDLEDAIQPHPKGPRCVSCATCDANFRTCLNRGTPYSICKLEYDKCRQCPCY